MPSLLRSLHDITEVCGRHHLIRTLPGSSCCFASAESLLCMYSSKPMKITEINYS